MTKKKKAKRKSRKKSATVTEAVNGTAAPASILCNTITQTKHFYRFLSAPEGGNNPACGNKPGKISLKKVNAPVPEGTCTDGRPIFRITFK